MMDCKSDLQIKQNKKTLEPGRNNKIDSNARKFFSKWGFVFSAHHAITDKI
jgi:hypothetical protein